MRERQTNKQTDTQRRNREPEMFRRIYLYVHFPISAYDMINEKNIQKKKQQNEEQSGNKK